MNINQRKVVGLKNTIDIMVNFSDKEITSYASELGFKNALKGETLKRAKGDLPTHCIFSIDQAQGDKHQTFLGFGATESETCKANRIYYTIEQKGVEVLKEGVENVIVYKVTSVIRDGKEYKVNPKATYKGLAIDTNFTCTYGTKSAKNSTLFQFFRKLVSSGFISVPIPSFLELVSAPNKQASTPKQTNKQAPKQAPKNVSKQNKEVKKA